MFDSERTYTEMTDIAWQHKLSRQLFCQTLKQLPHGHLVLMERGQLIGTFGNNKAPLHAQLHIQDSAAYSKLLLGGSVSAGEAYVDGLWDSPDLTALIQLFARNLPILDEIENKLRWLVSPIRKLIHWKNRNTADQAKKNIASHYDLGNQLYTRFLDDSMMYSSAIYPYPESTLREAQQHKLATISKKLQLSEHDHVLEIGTGWGGLAIYMAQHYGCHVTTTTISDEQFAYAEEKVNALGLTDKITLLKQDYRKLTGKFDKLVSIEMIEAVGKSYLETFFKQCNQLLKDDGLMVLQSITISDQRFEHYANDVDFIQKHIFPGGFLPSLLTVNQSIKSCTDMMIRDLQDIGLDYAHTLKNWHQNLIENQDELNQLGYDDRFIRLWRYYFCYCEGGFLERATSTIQLVMTKPRYYDALTR